MLFRGPFLESNDATLSHPARPLQAWEKAAAQSNRRWLNRRRQRLAAHAARVEEHLRAHPGRAYCSAGRCSHKRRRMVWCMELKRAFSSLTEAAAFVDRQPCNILQAINLKVRCGPYRWESFDPLRHGPAPSPSEWRSAAGETEDARRTGSAARMG